MPTELEQDIEYSYTLRPGDDHRRAYVGLPQQYDFMSATQFNLLTSLGLREGHTVVDLGCGSLRVGRLLIQYLMPGRYIGVEPNPWLIRDALEHELGKDLERLKAPRFIEDDSFLLNGVEDESADVIIAQSIFSHTGYDTFAIGLKSIARVMKPQGQALFTAIRREQAPKVFPDGAERTGWIYPGCTIFSESEVTDACKQVGLHAQKLDWFHPRQTWYRATRDPSLALDTEMHAALGTGRPLFDSRFP